MIKEIVQNSSFEGELVKYYEMFFYNNKEDVVQQTAAYVKRFTDEFSIKNCSDETDSIKKGILLDIGCGTGVYEDSFSSAYDQVIALDISRDMIEYASMHHRYPNCEYHCFDICKNSIMKGEVDYAVALSHVIGYQTTNDMLRRFLKNISDSLNRGGCFVFNFYNEPGILRGKLSPRVTTCEKGDVSIKRESNATPILMQNVLLEEYLYHIEDKKNDINLQIKINEKIRYFTVLELEEYLYECDMEILSVNTFLTNHELSGEEWNGCIIARKK